MFAHLCLLNWCWLDFVGYLLPVKGRTRPTLPTDARRSTVVIISPLTNNDDGTLRRMLPSEERPMLTTCIILKVMSGMNLLILLFNITDVQTRSLRELTSHPRHEYLVDTFTPRPRTLSSSALTLEKKELTDYMNNKSHHGWMLHAPISQIVSNLAFENRPLPVFLKHTYSRDLYKYAYQVLLITFHGAPPESSRACASWADLSRK